MSRRTLALAAALACVVALGFVIRVQFIDLYGGRGEAYFAWADAHYFGNISRSYVAYATVIHDGRPYDTLLYPPGYSGVLASLMFAGMTTAGALRMAQAAIDTSFILVIFALGRAVRLSTPATLVAATAYAVDPLWASGSTFLLAESLSPLLVVGAIGAIVWADGRARIAWVVPGIAIGCAVLFRPDLLLLSVPAVAYAAIARDDGALARAGLVLCGVAIALGPWGLHNRTTHGSWTFTSTGGGAGLLEGLGDRPGPYAYLDNDSVANHFVVAAGLKWGTPRASRVLTAEYLRIVRRDPLEALRTVAYRWRAILFESEHLQPLFFGRVREWVDRFGFIVLVVASILARRDRRLILVVVTPVFVALFGIGLVHYEPRYVRYVQLGYVFGGLYLLDRVWVVCERRRPRLALVGAVAIAICATAYSATQLFELHRAAQRLAAIV